MRELWKVSSPVMLSFLSMTAMLFVDRIMLSRYSINAMNASVEPQMLCWAFFSTCVACTAISEVFVARHHGAKEYQLMGAPVWQMLWLSLISALFFFPIAFLGGRSIYPETAYGQMQSDYFFWMMLFGPFAAARGALVGFFVGRGRGMVVTYIAIISNVVNALLDRLFIFGWEGVIPEMGVKGAAIATSLGSIFEGVVLFLIFIRPAYRERFGTGRMHLRWDLMKSCLKIGNASAAAGLFEVLGWAVFYTLLAQVSAFHLTIAGIVQSMIILFWFVIEGFSKGTTAIVGNLIGAGRLDKVSQVIASGLKWILLMGLLEAIGIFFLSDRIIETFLPGEGLEQEKTALLHGLGIMVAYLILEGLRFIFAGVLIAGGDTRFIMLSNVLCIWFCVVTPVYLLILKGGGSIELALFITVCCAAVMTLSLAARYLFGEWNRKIEPPSEEAMGTQMIVSS